jgi:hypothetical protein
MKNQAPGMQMQVFLRAQSGKIFLKPVEEVRARYLQFFFFCIPKILILKNLYSWYRLESAQNLEP